MEARTVNLLGALVVSLQDALGAAVVGSAGHGLSGAAALTTLHHFPELGVGEVTRWLGLSQSAGVRVLDRLAAEGLVERAPGADGRSVRVVVTAEGHRRAEEVLAARHAVLADALAAVGEDEEPRLVALLEKLLSRLTADGPHANRICRLCEVPACPDASCPVTLAAIAAEATRKEQG